MRPIGARLSPAPSVMPVLVTGIPVGTSQKSFRNGDYASTSAIGSQILGVAGTGPGHDGKSD